MSASGRVCPEADSIRVELAPAVHIARARERFGDVQIVLPPASYSNLGGFRDAVILQFCAFCSWLVRVLIEEALAILRQS
jgi:hypothetical protein